MEFTRGIFAYGLIRRSESGDKMADRRVRKTHAAPPELFSDEPGAGQFPSGARLSSTEAVAAAIRRTAITARDTVTGISYQCSAIIFAPMKIGRASCRKECRSRWSPYH